MLSFTDKFHAELGIEDYYEAPQALFNILLDKEKREKLFMSMLEYKEYDVSYDWFHEYFQNEHADRKKKKQDFTPNCLGKLLAKLTAINSINIDDNYYEIAAGTGGLMIKHWEEQRIKESPFTYSTWDHFHTVEELSDRTIPFLLFNMLIRGMNGVVIHGDSLSRNCKGVFFVQNFEDDHLSFSDLNILPYTNEIADEFAVKFEWVKTEKAEKQTDPKYKRESTKGYYPQHIERSWFDSNETMQTISQIINSNLEKKKRMQETDESDLPDEVKQLLRIFGL